MRRLNVLSWHMHGSCLHGSYLHGSYLHGSYLHGSYLHGSYLHYLAHAPQAFHMRRHVPARPGRSPGHGGRRSSVRCGAGWNAALRHVAS